MIVLLLDAQIMWHYLPHILPMIKSAWSSCEESANSEHQHNHGHIIEPIISMVYEYELHHTPHSDHSKSSGSSLTNSMVPRGCSCTATAMIWTPSSTAFCTSPPYSRSFAWQGANASQSDRCTMNRHAACTPTCPFCFGRKKHSVKNCL